MRISDVRHNYQILKSNLNKCNTYNTIGSCIFVKKSFLMYQRYSACKLHE